MNVDVAKKLLPMVNVGKHEDALSAYADDRIAYLYAQLEQATSVEDMYRLQGQLKEIRRMYTLPEEARARAKDA